MIVNVFHIVHILIKAPLDFWDSKKRTVSETDNYKKKAGRKKRVISSPKILSYMNSNRFKYKLSMHKVQRADLTCDVIRKVAPFVLIKL